MRWTNLSLLLGLASWTAAASTADEDGDPAQENTYFNQKAVPPMLELTPDNFDKVAKATNFLMVKHFSPWCPHCTAFAPTYQTLYEFYATSTPAGSANSDADFTKFYDFKFGAVDCEVYYDLCVAHGVRSFPTTIIYKNGESVETFRGGTDMKTLSAGIEKILESAKPGTRPAALTLPKPGDKSTPDGSAADQGTKTTPKVPAKEEETSAASKLLKEASKKDDAKKDDTKKDDVKGDAKKQESKSTLNKDDVKKDDAKDEKATAPADAPFIPNPFATVKPVKSTATPNAEGKSVSLSAETFQSLVTMTHDSWFIKFYAPWCHHCQALAPNWEQLSKSMKGKLNIGEVNCDVESRLCKEVRLRGYPTIIFFKGGERIEYDGLRGVGDLIQYAEKAIDIADGVQDVDAASLKALEEKEEVIFVYFYDHATTSEDFMALERLPLSLIGHAKLVRTQDPELFKRYKITTWPRLLVSREGRPTYYPPLTPNEMRDTRQVLDWMRSVWLPIVPEVTASNAREVMDGKLVVLGILNRQDNEAFLSAKREMKTAATEWMDKQIQLFQLERQELRDAKQLRIEEAEDRGDQRGLRSAKSIRIDMNKSERKEVAFAWVDGVFWQRWIKTTYGVDLKDGDRVIINDEDNRRYWDQTSTGNPIIPSRTSILETINKVTASPPSIRPKLTISSIEKIFFDIRMTFSEHPWLSMGCVFGLALGGASWFRGRLRRTRGHFRLDDGSRDFKGPLLGVNANGKTD